VHKLFLVHETKHVTLCVVSIVAINSPSLIVECVTELWHGYAGCQRPIERDELPHDGGGVDDDDDDGGVCDDDDGGGGR
jgi:hypothetical protein